MNTISETLDHELTMLYLANNDLSNLSPEALKQRYFDVLYRIQIFNIERNDLSDLSPEELTQRNLDVLHGIQIINVEGSDES